MSAPSREDCAAFGLRGEPTLLTGGEGLAYTVDDVVMKRVIDVEEANWTQALLHRIDPEGYRVADPIATVDAQWVHDGWVASQFIDDLRPAAPAWAEIIDAGLRFG